MKDTAPADAKGYVAVSIGGGEHWQGFHVTDDHKAAGEHMLATVREANASAGPQPATEVNRGLPAVPDADQPTVGALAAVLAHLMRIGTAVPQPAGAQAGAILTQVGAAAWALREVTGERWLHVAATRDQRGGWSTRVRRYDAADLDEAREAIVADIQRARFGAQVSDGFMDAVRQAEEHRPKT